MSNRYVRLPNSTSDHNAMEDEMQAAFDYREGDDEDEQNASESQPLNQNASATAALAPRVHVPGIYNFDSVDYDYPPPGSPPPVSANAFPNSIGNSNGIVPNYEGRSIPAPRRTWWKRAASTVLPSNVVDRLGLSSEPPAGLFGGGMNNDGVFANVTAKPSAPLHIQDGDETYVVPEDTTPEAPPSYASAQADAVPPYWETTVHAPFSPDSMGEMIIDSLPTGSLFSFCWNMLVSISFQFVGFLLTYLLHTSHAARLGSRAGLGVTLIQYGFALRGRLDNADGNGRDSGGWAEWKPTEPHPPFASAAEAEAWYASHGGTNSTSSSIGITEDQANVLLADATTEWLSFFLMTIGWFVLLTSLLGFYRVKRWERGILASQRRDTDIVMPAIATTVSTGLDSPFAVHGMSRIELLRNGFGFGSRRNPDTEEDRAVLRAEEGEARETDVMTSPDIHDPQHQRVVQVLERERRLRDDLRNAGLL